MIFNIIFRSPDSNYVPWICFRLQIIIDDCTAVLHKNIQEGQKFDYVINDLTEYPVEKAVKGISYKDTHWAMF